MANYLPNSLSAGSPRPAKPSEGGYQHYAERVDGRTVRSRSLSFSDHFTQARMFLASKSAAERAHLTDALRFEIGKVDRLPVRARVVNDLLALIDIELATAVAQAVGVEPPSRTKEATEPGNPSAALSLERSVKRIIANRSFQPLCI